MRKEPEEMFKKATILISGFLIFCLALLAGSVPTFTFPGLEWNMGPDAVVKALATKGCVIKEDKSDEVDKVAGIRTFKAGNYSFGGYIWTRFLLYFLDNKLGSVEIISDNKDTINLGKILEQIETKYGPCTDFQQLSEDVTQWIRKADDGSILTVTEHTKWTGVSYTTATYSKESYERRQEAKKKVKTIW
jgi:hypothetical protein